MELDGTTAIRELRWTRSDPPGKAADNAERGSIYTAALEQFEELFNAATRLGPATKPLPLFYALSQAGRAIVAAHGDSPRTFGHGLTQVSVERETEVPILHREVRRRSGRQDTFGAVARATRSGDFDGTIELGAAWVANPNGPRVSMNRWQANWRLALQADDLAAYGIDAETHRLVVFPFCDPWQATADHGSEIDAGQYPTVPTAATTTVEPIQGERIRTWRATVGWPSHVASMDDVAPKVRGDRHLLPRLVGQTQLLSPLMLWWIVLFGFSIYARYNPELWVRSLDVNTDVDAVGIERMLDAAIEHIPALVYEAVTGDFYPVPETLRCT